MGKIQVIKEKIKDTNTLFFVLIILIGLIIYKSYFSHFEIFAFLFINTILIIIFWNYKKSYLTLIILNEIKKFPYWSAFFSISLYFLIFLPVEFLLTDVWYVTPKIPQPFVVGVISFFCLIFSLTDWRRLLKGKISILTALIFIAAGGAVYLGYRREKISREYLPKIYKISPSWGVQAQIIKLEGVNFGPSWKGGKVVLGILETTIKEWQDNYILAEQPVSSPFGLFNLKIVRADGQESNFSSSYEVRDPDKLKR